MSELTCGRAWRVHTCTCEAHRLVEPWWSPGKQRSVMTCGRARRRSLQGAPFGAAAAAGETDGHCPHSVDCPAPRRRASTWPVQDSRSMRASRHGAISLGHLAPKRRAGPASLRGMLRGAASPSAPPPHTATSGGDGLEMKASHLGAPEGEQVARQPLEQEGGAVEQDEGVGGAPLLVAKVLEGPGLALPLLLLLLLLLLWLLLAVALRSAARASELLGMVWRAGDVVMRAREEAQRGCAPTWRLTWCCSTSLRLAGGRPVGEVAPPLPPSSPRPRR